MKRGVMLLLIVGGLTAMGEISAQQVNSAVYSGPIGGNGELLTGAAFPDVSDGSPRTVFTGADSSPPSNTIIRKTLKGYRSINRKTYPIPVMELV